MPLCLYEPTNPDCGCFEGMSKLRKLDADFHPILTGFLARFDTTDTVLQILCRFGELSTGDITRYHRNPVPRMNTTASADTGNTSVSPSASLAKTSRAETVSYRLSTVATIRGIMTPRKTLDLEIRQLHKGDVYNSCAPIKNQEHASWCSHNYEYKKRESP